MTGSNSPGSAPFVAQSAKTNESAGDLKWRCQWSFMHERDLLGSCPGTWCRWREVAKPSARALFIAL
ncbi:hypothetical protein ELI15_27415 (plasmid) [Rhizobium ruizarguesonis]|nr:hypothetical protein ELI15_27415 [Rhizobium ruizarguesonis]